MNNYLTTGLQIVAIILAFALGRMTKIKKYSETDVHQMAEDLRTLESCHIIKKHFKHGK